MQARILIVDDRTTNLRIYEQYVKLMGPGYSAHCFHNPVEALDWLKTERADLMIVDYRMPQMNGADFIRAVRQTTRAAPVPAIIITARQDRGCRISAIEAGATDFLQSPVTHTEFTERVQLLLQQHQNLKERRADNQSPQFASEAEAQQAAVSRSRSLLEQIIDTTPVMLNATDRNGKVLFMNAHQAAMLGEEAHSIVGRVIYKTLESNLARREKKRNDQVIREGIEIPSYEEQFRADGISLTFHCNKSPLTNKDGHTIGVLTTAIDITARKFAEEHRAHLALHDMLTGMPNRSLLHERIHETIKESKEGGKPAAMLLLDLDRFKVINDTRGHQAGDQLLRQVAERINAVISPGDFAARIGGDEFAVILRDVDDDGIIELKSNSLLRELGRPYLIDKVDQVIGASIGVVVIPSDGEDPDDLLRQADLAMYEAKALGRNRIHFFSSELNRVAQLNAEIEGELRSALLRDEFILEYQPIVSADDNRFCGLEALLRWNHPERGRLMPNAFLQIANDSGLIDEIGQKVIETACREISKFKDQGIQLPTVAVNVSPRQFYAVSIADAVLANVTKFDIPADSIAIEITEELLLDQNTEILGELDKLRRYGVGISIDDFGTGYSSLQYLRDLPATKLKIDQTFVSRVENSSADRAIISTIAHLAHAMDMRIVAEGVENEAQFALLRAAGCDELQGYFIGRPLTTQQLRELFLRDNVFFKAGPA